MRIVPIKHWKRHRWAYVKNPDLTGQGFYNAFQAYPIGFDLLIKSGPEFAQKIGHLLKEAL